MNREFEKLIDIFVSLGQRLEGFGSDCETKATIRCAVQCNPWFTANDIVAAANAIRTQMLNREQLIRWLQPYELGVAKHKRIGIIMAGNIPFVGFFDLLCVIVAGCDAVVKYSSKDAVLMEYIVGELRKICEDIHIYRYDSDTQIDAIIATGSDNTNRYFRTQFRDIPSLLRGSRYSVAVLSGNETDDQLALLSKDIFTYSGLGCRNVSHMLVPDNYNVEELVLRLSSFEEINEKYKNNYLQNRALLLMSGDKFYDGRFFTLRRYDETSLYISELSYQTYSSPAWLREWFEQHDSQLQCVVSNSLDHPRAVAFGEAQCPRLCDYPDSVDVIEFVKKL